MDSNDVLYGGDPHYLAELQAITNKILEQVLQEISTFSQSSDSGVRIASSSFCFCFCFFFLLVVLVALVLLVGISGSLIIVHLFSLFPSLFVPTNKHSYAGKQIIQSISARTIQLYS